MPENKNCCFTLYGGLLLNWDELSMMASSLRPPNSLKSPGHQMNSTNILAELVLVFVASLPAYSAKTVVFVAAAAVA